MANLPQKEEKLVSFEDISTAFASRSNFQVKKTYWLFKLMNQAQVVNLGTFFIKLALKLQLPIKNLIKNTIFEQFCGGQSITDCNITINLLANANIGTILDYSVEGEETEKSFELTTIEIISSVEKASVSTNIPFSVFKVSGIASKELLEKVQKKAVLSNSESKAFELIKERINSICYIAHKNNVRLLIDAEESWIQDVIDSLTYEMMKCYNKEKAIIFNTYQLYRVETLDNIKRAYLKGRENGYQIGAKLVRGAYMEKERIRARENNYIDPIHSTKEEVDADYYAAIEFCLEHLEYLAICLGTHNEYSCKYCIRRMKKIGLQNNDNRIWFAQLLGMSDNITYNLSKAGYNAAKYVPYGPIEAVMPYLIRRARENTSMSGQSSRELLLVKREMERRSI